MAQFRLGERWPEYDQALARVRVYLDEHPYTGLDPHGNYPYVLQVCKDEFKQFGPISEKNMSLLAVSVLAERI